MKYEDVIQRISFLRNKANLSQRKTSEMLGFCSDYMKTIENYKVNLKMKTFLDFCELIDIKPEEFFFYGKDYNDESKKLVEDFNKLSPANKQTILDLVKKLQ